MITNFDEIVFVVVAMALFIQYFLAIVFMAVDYAFYVKYGSSVTALDLRHFIPFWWVVAYSTKFFSLMIKYKKDIGGSSLLNYFRETYGKGDK